MYFLHLFTNNIDFLFQINIVLELIPPKWKIFLRIISIPPIFYSFY